MEMMVCKNYNIKKETTLKIAEESYPIIRLGERGRGRKEEFVIVDEDIGGAKFVRVIKKTKLIYLKSIYADVETDLWIARVNTDLRYKRNCFGHIKIKESQKDNIQIVEYGIGAYGEAGRIGEWIDYLLCVRDGTILYVNPSGAYSFEKYYLLFEKDRVLKLSKEEKEIYEGFHTLSYDPEEEFTIILK